MLRAPLVILMCGPPCGGKTTAAVNMAALFNATRLSTDDIVIAEAEKRGMRYDELFAEYHDEALVKYRRAVQHYTSVGGNIILDRSNTTVKSRAREMGFIPGHYKVIAVTAGFHLSTLELMARRDTRVARGGAFVPDSVIEFMHTNCQEQPPTIDEGFSLVLHAGSL